MIEITCDIPKNRRIVLMNGIPYQELELICEEKEGEYILKAIQKPCENFKIKRLDWKPAKGRGK